MPRVFFWWRWTGESSVHAFFWKLLDVLLMFCFVTRKKNFWTRERRGSDGLGRVELGRVGLACMYGHVRATAEVALFG